jgi:predicted nuclease of restriction endonuclease-like RecB superfamily
MKFKTKNTKIAIFLISVLLTAVIAFWLPTSYYFLPKIADEIDLKSEEEKHIYTVFSDKATYITDDWEFYWEELMITEGHRLYIPDLTVQLPSAWTTYEINGEHLTSGGYASYRKVIKNVDFDDSMIIDKIFSNTYITKKEKLALKLRYGFYGKL